MFAVLEPAAILARISSGDPLRLYELGARQLRERFFFVDQDRLYELVLAFVAHHAAVEKQSDPEDGWLRGIIDRAIDSILTEDAEEQRRMAAPNDPQDRRYYHLGLSLGVEPHVARSAVVNFNALPDRTRMGFFRLLIENRSVADTLAEGIWEPDELRHDIWDGLRALGHLREGQRIGKAAKRRRLSRAQQKQLALVFYRACQRSVILGHRAGLCRVLRKGEWVVLDPEDRWRSMLENVLGFAEGTLEGRMLHDMRAGIPQSGVKLAHASFRLDPREETRIWLGLACVNNGELAQARSCFTQTLRTNPDRFLRATCLGCLAYCDLLEGRLSRAFDTYSEAVQCAPLIPLLLGQMNLSIVTNDKKALFDAAHLLDAELDGDQQSIEECRVAAAEALSVARRFSPDDLSLARLVKRLPPAPRYILNQVAEDTLS